MEDRGYIFSLKYSIANFIFVLLIIVYLVGPVARYKFFLGPTLGLLLPFGVVNDYQYLVIISFLVAIVLAKKLISSLFTVIYRATRY